MAIDLAKLGLKPQAQVAKETESKNGVVVDAVRNESVSAEPAPVVPVPEHTTPAPKFGLGLLRPIPKADSGVVASSGTELQRVAQSSASPAEVASTNPQAAAPASTLGSRLALLTTPAPPKPEFVPLSTLDPIPDGPIGFQERLDRLEALVETDKGLSGPAQGVARSYVQVIMKELVTHPEYDGMVIARDVHNIMVFARSQMTAVVATVAKKKEAAANREAKTGSATFDFSGLDALMTGGGGAGAAAAAVKAGSLDALAELNLDDIESTMTRSYGKK